MRKPAKKQNVQRRLNTVREDVAKVKQLNRDAIYFAYAGLGPTRTLKKLSKLVGISNGTLEYWSIKYDWQERIKGIDASVRAQIDEMAIQSLIPTARECQELRSLSIRNTSNQLKETGPLTKVPDNKIAWEMARTELGLPTKFQKIEQSNTNRNVMTTDELEDLHKNGIVIDNPTEDESPKAVRAHGDDDEDEVEPDTEE